MRLWVILPLLFIAFAATTVAAQNKRDDQVKKDKRELADDKNWIYNDLGKGIQTAKATKKPLLVVFR